MTPATRNPLRAVKPPELRALYAEAVARGCTATLTAGGHVRVVTPGGAVYFGCQTSSDGYRAALNARAQLRKMGVEL